MVLQQINLRVEQGLLASLKVLARERGLSLNAAAALAFERYLLGQPQQKQAEASTDHEQRLLALEKRVATLEARPATPPPPKAASPDQAKPIPPIGPAKIPQVGDDAITTAQLAATLGIKRNTFNERLRRAGGASEGVVIEGWRCVGQARPANGGPLQWLWEVV